MAWSIGFKDSVFLPPCYPSYEASDFCLGGTNECLPLNMPAFAGHTTAREVFPHAAFRKSSVKGSAVEGVAAIGLPAPSHRRAWSAVVVSNLRNATACIGATI